jgi:hypothetical protein
MSAMTGSEITSSGFAVGGCSEASHAMRRLVGLQREYRCSAGHEHRSWERLRACPDCGETLAVAVIRRAALV